MTDSILGANKSSIAYSQVSETNTGKLTHFQSGFKKILFLTVKGLV